MNGLYRLKLRHDSRTDGQQERASYAGKRRASFPAVALHHNQRADIRVHLESAHNGECPKKRINLLSIGKRTLASRICQR
jgi:hypothetical protein